MKKVGVIVPSQPTPPDERMARLMRVLRLLASRPAKVERQTSMSRGDTPGRDDAQVLVVEFDDAYTAFVEGFRELPSESQMIALQAVDTKLSAMVGAKDAALWTNRARREDQVWTELRELVAGVIGKFAWPEPETSPGTSAH